MSDVANLDRASSAWDALARCLVRRDDMLIVKDFPRRRARTAAVWPVGQVLAAAAACLPLGLAHGWKLLKGVSQGNSIKWSDVAFDANNTAVRVRREMEQLSRGGAAGAPATAAAEERARSARTA